MPLSEEQKQQLGIVEDSRLGISLQNAARKNPDQSAKIVGLADSQRLPSDTVERNLPEVDARQNYGHLDPEQIRKDSPVTASHLSEPDNAAVSIDDVENMQGIERNLEMKPWEPSWWEMLTSGSNNARAMNEWAARAVSKEDGITIEEAYQKTGGYRPMFNPEGRNTLEALTAAGGIVARQLPDVFTAGYNTVLRVARGGDDDVDDSSWLDQAIEHTEIKPSPDADPNYEAFNNTAQSLGYSLATLTSSIIASAGTTLATGGNIPAGVAAGFAASGTVAYRGSKDEFIDRIKDKLSENYEKIYGKKMSQEVWDVAYDEYESAAIKYGAWEAIPEAASNIIFLRLFAAPLKGATAATLATTTRKVMDTIVSEQLTETLTAVGQSSAEEDVGLGKSKNLGEAFRSQAIQTLVLTGTMAGGGKAISATWNATIGSRIDKNATRAAKSMNEQLQIDEFLTLSQNSTTRERAQDRFRTFLRAAGKDKAVYIPAAEINKLIEQGVELPQYIVDQANEVDSDVEIPIDRFATEIASDVGLMGKLRPHIKLSGDTMTGAELEEDQSSSIHNLMVKANMAADLKTEIDAIYEDVKDQLVATGRQSDETAKYSAMIIKSQIATKAEELGMSPKELYERMNFKIKGPDFDPESESTTLDQAQQRGYQGTEMSEAVEWVRAVNDKLDMTPDGRNDRANEMGFVTDAFHGTLFADQNLDEDSRRGILEFDKATGDIGYHFGSTAEQANTRITAKENEDRVLEEGEVVGEEAGNVLPIRLKMQNPIRLTDSGEWRNSVGVAQTLIDSGQFDESTMVQLIEIDAEARELERQFDDNFEDSRENEELNDEMREIIKAAGYDGIVYRNQVEGTGDSYIVFDANQVRSTNAAFHPMYEESANILSQDGESEITIERRQLDKRIGVIENLVRCMGS